LRAALPTIALAHDYLTQRGGAERVVLSLTRAFPGALLHTSLYDPNGTFPEFVGVEIRTSRLNAVPGLRRHHRLALPLLAPTFSRLRIDADVDVCSSSGWAHGARIDGTKIVYCHTPARWLYQPERYLRGRGAVLRAVATALRPALERWDRNAAASADRYVANSSAVADRIARLYGIQAEVLPPPPAITPDGPARERRDIGDDFILCVSRLLPYKNVDAVVRAFADLPRERLVVAGTGPEYERLRALAGPNVQFVGRLADDELRWLYVHCSALVAAAHEDFGLTPLEAAAFGKPAAVLRWGGFLDTVAEGTSGLYFDEPIPDAIVATLHELRDRTWNETAIRGVADSFSETRFIERIREIAGV